MFLKKLNILNILLLMLSVSFCAKAELSERFSFAGNDNKIKSSGNLTGIYIPSNDPDNDTPEMQDPKRYRVKGKVDQALKFYRSLGSYAKINNFKISANSEKLYLAVIVKPRQYQIGVVTSCKIDSSRNGFALFLWGREWRFQYGDGSKSYTAKFKTTPYRGDWKFVEIFFDKGQVECKENGNSLGKVKLAGKNISPNSYPLYIGNYPGKSGRKRYAFNGMIDELIIADSKSQANLDFSKKVTLNSPALEVICEPVEGNEKHFGGVLTFNTFKEYPVPLSFKFRGNSSKLKNAKFNLYLPEDISLLEAFQSNHNCRDEAVKMTSEKVVVDNKKYLKYTTPKNYDFKQRLSQRYGSGKIITCALGQTGQATSGKIYWSVSSGAVESPKKSAIVKFIEPLKSAKAGKFMVMNYFLAGDMMYHNAENFKKVSELFKISGMTGKGRAYKSLKRRCKLEDQLLEDGFTLYEISLWYGPLTNKRLGVSPAIDGRGKKSGKYVCPTELLNSDLAKEKYEKEVKNCISVGKTQYAVLDYEPWGVPSRACYCPVCLKAFKKKFSIKEDLNASLIKRKYRNEWAKHWVDNSAGIIKMMCDALHEADPAIKVVEYTYLFQYNNPKKMNQRWWSIPKDPRLNEKYLDESMLSLYHVNGTKAFNLLNFSTKSLKKSVSVIASLSRAQGSTAAYTTEEEALSPRQLRQKAVMCAALGVKTFGLWPGTCIDGAYHVALGKACRDVWKYENYYFSGKRVDKLVKVVPAKPLRRNDYAYTAWQKDDKILVSLFNFSKKELSFQVGKNKKTVKVPADGYALVIIK